MRFSIRWKVLFMILGLITLVLLSIGIYITRTQAADLKENMIQNAKMDARNFGFRSARAILDRDDLSLSDNLQSMGSMPGYVYGQVLNPNTRSTIVEMFEKNYDNEKSEYNSQIPVTFNPDPVNQFLEILLKNNYH